MEAIVKPMEWAEAVRKLEGRHPVGSALRTSGWEQVPLALRERAFFSAGVEQARTLQRLKDVLQQAQSPGEFTAKAREWLLANGHQPPGSERDLRTLTSRRRLELIFTQQLEAARGFGWWKQGQDPDVLDAFPAQEFVRVEARNRPRADWARRWTRAGGRFFEGRMVALKSDRVWRELSRFGTPWPPFDFGSGMGVDDVDRMEAERLGVLPRGAPVQGDEEDFNARLSASVQGLDREMLDFVELSFGDQVKVSAGLAQWTGKVPYTDWKDARMESAHQWQPAGEMPPRIDAEEGRRQMAAGVTVSDPQGRPVTFNQKTLDHWRGYQDERLRPTYLPAALSGAQIPTEIWEQADQMVYLTIFSKPDGSGYRGVAIFSAKDGGQARTYFVKGVAEMDKIRRGIRRVYP